MYKYRANKAFSEYKLVFRTLRCMDISGCAVAGYGFEDADECNMQQASFNVENEEQMNLCTGCQFII